VQAHRLNQAKQLLISSGIPMQNSVFAVIDNYQLFIRDRISKQLQHLNADYNKTQIVVMSLGVGAFLIILWTAFYVIRSTTTMAREAYLEKEQALVTLGSIGDAVIATDNTGLIQLMNTEAENLTGWSQAKANKQPLMNVMSIINSKTGRQLPNPVIEALNTGQSITSTGHSALVNRNNQKYEIEYNASAINDQTDKTFGGVIVFRDVTENRELEKQLSHQASHDELTGLVNRREFEIRLNQAILNAKAEHLEYGLLYLDLDQFKVINDMGGHNAGDELLKQLSKLVKNILRESDTLARLGGDEFGILLEGCPLEKATDIAQTIRQAIAKFQFYWNQQVFTVGASIGIVMITEDAGNMNEVMSAVDTACYTAKDLGRNRIQIYQPGDTELKKRKNEMYWKQKITSAIADDAFVLYAQDISPVKETNNSTKFLEILVRLRDDDGNLIAPHVFFPAAERYSLTKNIDQWVIEQTLSSIAKLQLDKHSYNFSINLSGQSLNTNEMLTTIINQFETTGISPEMICFEITESMAIANLASARKFISILKGMGCRFALDDFGKGLCSFTYLKHIPVDMIKIDGSFVRDIVKDPVNISFIEAIIKIAHVMGLETVAEYVENEAIHNTIHGTGIDYVQGNYIASPVPLHNIFS
ncbi:MAG: EAL domain-containing protein, partial [Thioalkalispiraceae bacterium]|jgi:diguanylate cyclase (GGDEF)-like protein/PAS domain S-box-containing protein